MKDSKLKNLVSSSNWIIEPLASFSKNKPFKSYSPTRLYLTMFSANKLQGIRNNNLFFLHISDFGRIAEELSNQAMLYFNGNKLLKNLPEEGLCFDYELSTSKTTPSIARFRLLPFAGDDKQEYYETNVLFQLEYVITAITKKYSSIVIPNSASTHTN